METPTQAGRGVVSSTGPDTPPGSRPSRLTACSGKTDCAGWEAVGAPRALSGPRVGHLPYRAWAVCLDTPNMAAIAAQE